MSNEQEIALGYFQRELGLFVKEFLKLLLGMFFIGLSFTLMFEWNQLQVEKNKALWHHPEFAIFLAYVALVMAGYKAIARFRASRREA